MDVTLIKSADVLASVVKHLSPKGLSELTDNLNNAMNHLEHEYRDSGGLRKAVISRSMEATKMVYDNLGYRAKEDGLDEEVKIKIQHLAGKAESFEKYRTENPPWIVWKKAVNWYYS